MKFNDFSNVLMLNSVDEIIVVNNILGVEHHKLICMDNMGMKKITL